ncbi:hypothetical protein PP641_gp054 [Arthrobacter phage SilentRX]|uniref:Uncharacterized protein n=1 Tax=Arthrobacter phage SilentRX TaxID=2836091 RepID=A0A8F3IPP5_9CAUD|nr:hypothetical protein PP641_gp054 [Arthrobacter phage SilentRX]QWY82794.1 hypothetical protein SEA_SILENTRX_54 [Arthrobacter phage SilentRX]
MAQTPTITLLEPSVKVILIEDITIPVENIAYARPTDGGFYKVFFKTGGHVDLRVTADAFASALAGAPF